MGLNVVYVPMRVEFTCGCCTRYFGSNIFSMGLNVAYIPMRVEFTWGRHCRQSSDTSVDGVGLPENVKIKTFISRPYLP